jgi:5'(3')-deoxyribonucleotidase
MSRPVFLCDVDGVLADFTGHVLQTIREPHKITYSDITEWDIWSQVNRLAGREIADRRLLSSTAWWDAIPVCEGAQAAVDMVRRDGFDVVFVTAPWYGCADWEGARRRWLHQHFDARRCDVIPTERKTLIRGDILLDDRLENVLPWAAANQTGVALLRDTPLTSRVLIPGHIRRIQQLTELGEMK